MIEMHFSFCVRFWFQLDDYMAGFWAGDGDGHSELLDCAVNLCTTVFDSAEHEFED